MKIDLKIAFWLLLAAMSRQPFAFAQGNSQDLSLRKIENIASKGDADAEYRTGAIYAAKRKYAEAEKWFLQAAEHGQAEAQFALGNLYFDGLAYPRDYEKAASWYIKAADQGHAKAQLRLVDMYVKGQGVPQDLQDAIYMYRKAAEHGSKEMQFELAEKFRKGTELVPYEPEEAALWFRRAAEKGHVMAQFNLGEMYFKGEGIQVDMMKAYKWFNLASAAGNAKAKEEIEMVKSRLTAEQLEKLQNSK